MAGETQTQARAAARGDAGNGGEAGAKRGPRWLSLALAAVVAATLAGGAHLLARWVLNVRFLDSWSHGSYSASVPNTLTYLNWPCPYVPYHNLGCAAFMLENYDLAYNAFAQEYLDCDPPHESFPDVGCAARVNAALSLVKPLDVDHFGSEAERQALIEQLLMARGCLTDGGCGCANPEKGVYDGHSEAAERLKKEIDEALERLSDPSNDGSGGDQGDQGQQDEQQGQQQGDGQSDDGSSSQQESNLKDRLNKRRSEASQDRAEEQRQSGGTGNGNDAGQPQQGQQQGQGGGQGGDQGGEGDGGYRGKTW